MGARIRLGHRRQTFALDVSRLPASGERRGSRPFGVFIVLFGLVWGGFPLVALLGAAAADLETAEVLVMLVFPVFGAGLALFGLHQILWRKSIAIDGANVSVVERGLRGTRRWRAPLGEYRGVLAHTRRVRRNRRSYTLYLVDLVHPEPERTVNLYTALNDLGWRAAWEDYARRLGLPALEEGEDSLIVREVVDLDKSVGELLDEGKLEVDYASLDKRAKGLAADVEGDTVVLTRTGMRSAPLAWLLVCLIPLVFVYVGFVMADVPRLIGWLFGGLGLFFEIIFLLGAAWDAVSRERLRLRSDSLRKCTVSPWGETKGTALPAAAVESVKIAREPGRWSRAVVIASDRGTLAFGQRLPRDSLEFVRHAILAKLSVDPRGR